jgi:hypothetical protein
MDIGYDGRPPSVCRCRGFYCSLPSLEVVLVFVSDVDRAKTFYAEMVGIHVDFDSPISEEVRVVQLIPPGSCCSIQVYSEDGLRPRREGESLDNVGFVYFDDPDGNGWTVQQISSRD